MQIIMLRWKITISKSLRHALVLLMGSLILTGPWGLRVMWACKDTRSLYATENTPFYAIKTAMAWLGGKTMATVYREYYSPPDKWRIEYLAPTSAKGRIIIQRGSTIWQWEPAEKKVFITTGDVPTPRVDKLQPILEQNYKTEILAEKKTEAGRPVKVLQLTPLYPGKSKWIIYLDLETGVILRRERRTATGKYELISHCQEFRPGQQDARLFDPERLPCGKTVRRTWSGRRVSLSDLKKVVGVSLPATLPGGFKVDAVSVVHSSPLTAQLTYTDGLASVSLFASPSKDTASGEESKYKSSVFGHLTSVSWQASGITYTLVGDVSRCILFRIADSLKR